MIVFSQRPRLAASIAGALIVLGACGRPTPASAPPAPAVARPSIDPAASLATCSDLGGDSAPRLAACTAVIDSDAASDVRAKALNNRGVLKSGDGDSQGAIADFDAALALDPDYAAAVYNRGQAWRRAGDAARADADFSRALRLDPGLAKIIPAADR
jgi:Flp pilus assembly protein TadD